MWQGCAVPPRSRPTQLGKKHLRYRLSPLSPFCVLYLPAPTRCGCWGQPAIGLARGSSSFPRDFRAGQPDKSPSGTATRCALTGPSPRACAGGLTGVTWCEQFCAPVNPSCTQDQQQDTDADAPCSAVQRSWGTVVLMPQLVEEALLCHSAVPQCSAPTTGSSRPLRPKL
jgi:hypothetical protein